MLPLLRYLVAVLLEDEDYEFQKRLKKANPIPAAAAARASKRARVPRVRNEQEGFGH